MVLAVLAMLIFPTPSAAQGPTSPPGAPTGVTALPGTLSANVQWTPTGSAADSYTVTSDPGGITDTVSGTATSATVTGLGYLVRYRFTVTGTNTLGAGPASAPSEPVTPGAPGGPYHQGDGRVLANDDVTAGQPLQFNTGEDRVHAPGLSAVVLNITASQATAATDVQVVEKGEVEQTISLSSGEVQSSLVVVPAPAELTQAAIRVTTGTAHVHVDFVGFFTDPRTVRDHSGLLTMVATAPLLDTPLAAGSTTDVAVLGQGGIPTAHVGEVLLNVTATNAAGNGSFTLVPSGGDASATTTLGFAAGETTANRTIVAVSSSGSISVVDSYAGATIHIDVLGWFSDGTDAAAIGGLYNPLPHARLIDTTVTGGPLAPGATLNFPVYGNGGAPPVTATAPPTSVIVNISAIAPTGPGSISVAGATVLDYASGETTSRVAVVHLAADGSGTLGILGASTNVTVDLVAFFAGDLIVPGSTKVLPATLLAAITSVGNDGTVTFAPGTQVSPFIGLHDVIVAGISSATPNGLLLRVLKISTLSDGSVVLSTRNALLPEALTAFTIDWVVAPTPVRFGARMSGTPARDSAPAGLASGNPFPPPPNTSIDPRYLSLTLADPDHSLHLFPEPWADLALTDLEIQVLPHIQIQYNFFTNTAKAAFAFSEGVRLGLEATVTKDLVATNDVLLGPMTIALGPPIDVQIGPVPVIINPSVTFALTLDTSISVGVGVAYHFDKFVQITESYDGSQFHTSQLAKVYVNAFDPPFFFANAEAKVTFHIGPGITFYHPPGTNINPLSAGVDFNRFLSADATVTCTPQPSCFPNPWWQLSTGECIGVFLNLSLFLINKFFSQDLACAEQVLLQAPGPHLNVIITPSPATVSRFHLQRFQAVVSGSTSGVTFSVEGGDANGTLSNTGVTTFVDYTAPATAGDYRLVARPIDDPSSVAFAQIHVPADPPSAPRNVVAALTGATSATVSWTSPTDNGGAPINDYKVMSSSGATFDAGAATSATFSGLARGATFTFTVTATNQANLTSAGAVSNPITTPASTGPPSVAPTFINFGLVTVGETSASKSIVVTAGANPLAISTVTIAGLNPGDNPGEFQLQSDLCTGQTLSPGGTCSFAVLYKPTQRITANATVIITDNDPRSPQRVGLTGSSPVPSTPGIERIGDIQMIDSQHGYVIDQNGILATTDGGVTWSRRQMPVDAQIVPSLPGTRAPGRVHFINLADGFVLGCSVANCASPPCISISSCGAVVIGTTDGGLTWHDVATLPAGFNGTDMQWTDQQHGWVLGWTLGTGPTGTFLGIPHEATLYATTDGGQTWHLQPLPSPAAGSCPTESDIIPQVRFTDPQNGWYVSQALCTSTTFPFGQLPSQTFIATTNDGGATWTQHTVPSTVAQGLGGLRLQVLSPTQARFEGASTLIFPGLNVPVLVSTDDGGASFTAFKLPFTASDIRFVDATHAIGIASTNGALFSSSDGGASWTQVGILPEFTDPTGTLQDVLPGLLEFTDSSDIWMAGQADYPNSQQGVIMKSSDGGATWTVQLLGAPT